MYYLVSPQTKLDTLYERLHNFQHMYITGHSWVDSRSVSKPVSLQSISPEASARIRATIGNTDSESYLWFPASIDHTHRGESYIASCFYARDNTVGKKDKIREHVSMRY